MWEGMARGAALLGCMLAMITAMPPAARLGMIVGEAAAPPRRMHAANPENRYDAPPSVRRETYIAGWCTPGMVPGWGVSPACADAGAMYDVLVAAGLDPAVQFGQAAHETVLGQAGVGAPPIRNLHGVQCHAGDGRVGDVPVAWGNGCAGMYPTYIDSVRVWAALIRREYLPAGLNTPRTVVQRYAPPGADGNDPPAYVAAMEAAITRLRELETETTP